MDDGRSAADAASGHSAEPEPCSTVSAVPASVPNVVWVVIGSSGEYSDRYERVIGYVLTEEQARAAVEQAEVESKLPDPLPYPKHESTHAYRYDDGTWFDGYILDAPKGGKYCEKPDAAEITARQEAAEAAWRQARVDAGRIDPDGSMDSYYCEIAPLLASGMPLRENNEDCSRPKAGSPTAESGDAHTSAVSDKER